MDDPYASLEKLADPAVQQWLKAQAVYARQTLDAIPDRAALAARLRELDNRYAAGAYDIRIAGNGWQSFLRASAQDQPARLYSRLGQQGPEALLFDPAPAKSLITGFVPSPDGPKVAFVLMGADA